MNKIAIILKALSLMVILYVLIRAFAPALGEAFMNMLTGSKKKKNSDLDFDRMIEQKKAILRGDGQMTVQEALHAQKERKNRTDEVLHQEYEALTKNTKRETKDENRLTDLKVFMSYSDSLQWGGGPEFKEIASKISQALGARVEPTEVATAFSNLHRREAFIDPRGKLLELKRIKESLESFVSFTTLLKGGTPLAVLAKRWGMTPQSVEKAIIHLFQQKTGKSDINKIISQKGAKLPANDSIIILSLLKNPAGGLKTKTEVQEKIREEAELFHTLSPLPPLKGKNDKKGAFKSLGLPENATQDQIKKQYKKLARLKHPDRLRGKGIPQEFESIATENFTQIKAAYDILMSK